MRKPEHRWRTRLHEAVLVPAEGAASAHDETFELRFSDGRRGRATLQLRRQVACAVALEDPDLEHAVRCWLAARGCCELALFDEAGTSVASGPFDVESLGDPVPDAVPQRLVTLAPSVAELVHALGVFERVVACEDSSDYPPQVAELPRLGPDLGPDLEQVAALKPDLVLSSLTVPGMERIVTELRARGLPQVVLAPASVADVLSDLTRVGRRLGVPEAAERVVADMRRQLQRLEASRPAEPVRIYLEWWPRPMFSPGRDSYADELITLAGGLNVFGQQPGASVQIDAEQLVAAAPELCFLSWCGVDESKLDPDNLCGRAGLEALSAARARRVYPLDERFSGRPGPRMLEAARRMAAAIAQSGVRA
ncbi:MAG: cobalamin-binding protein [Myxococcota bacterium]